MHFGVVIYGTPERAWLDKVGKHYLQNAPPGCFFAVGVRASGADLLGHACGIGPLLGLCLLGRPVARRLPQDGTWAEITRMVLVAGLPHGTASEVLRFAATEARRRGMQTLIAYHDRTRHTGCIYRKAGFRKDGTTDPQLGGWATRPRRTSATYEATPKRRWRMDLQTGT